MLENFKDFKEFATNPRHSHVYTKLILGELETNKYILNNK